MKRVIIVAVIFVLIFASCTKGTDKTKEAEDKTAKTTQTENTNTNVKSADEGIKNTDGETVTADDLNELVNKANDPSTDEETKKELLNEIDYILKQAEK